MTIDLASMTPQALQKLITEATREHKRKKKRAPLTRVRAKVARLLKSEGYTLQELYGDAIAATASPKQARRKTTRLGTTKRKIAPKYRNPNNAEETWTGRGRQPLWFVALIESGKTREDLEIRD